jgi:pimeloyl-ACP methyl ester carboxylesterase
MYLVLTALLNDVGDRLGEIVMVAAEFTEESTSHFTDLGWTNLHYNEVGTGDALLLLHGGGLGATSWSNFVLNIAPLSEHFRVLAVDAPGFGKSGPLVLTDQPRTTVAARAFRDLMDALKIDKASFVGNSMGGANALTFAADYPERVNKVVMMGAAPVGQVAMFTPMIPTEGIKALTRVYTDPTFENFRAMYDLMVYDGSHVPDDALKLRAANVNDEHRRNWLAGQASGLFRNLLQDLPKVKVPLLLIHGRNDTMSPLEFSIALLPLLPSAELHVFNRCGHWAQYEQAKKFNRMVLDFLQHDE